MKIRLCFSIIVILWLSCFQPVNASVIDDSGPNSLVVGKSFGFMLFGNDGFMKPGIENISVDGCTVSYETNGVIFSHAIQRIYISYDLNKANWLTAVYNSNYYKDVVMFEIFGDMGLREVRYDHTFKNDDELREGVSFLGLTVGPQNYIKIRLPNYITKKIYDRAVLDLKEQCPGR